MEWANKKTVVVTGVLAMLGMMCAFWAQWRFHTYVREHGGGMPGKTEDGRYILNDHGRETPITKPIYREAKKRWFLLVGIVLFELCAGLLFMVILVQGGVFKQLMGVDKNGE